jgi:hypothetical protein
MSFPRLQFIEGHAKRSWLANIFCSSTNGSSIRCNTSGLEVEVHTDNLLIPYEQLADSNYSSGIFWDTIELVQRNAGLLRVTGLTKSDAAELTRAIAHNEKAFVQQLVAPHAEALADVHSEIAQFTQGDIYLFSSLARYLVNLTDPLRELLGLQVRSGMLPGEIERQIQEVKHFVANHEAIYVDRGVRATSCHALCCA